MVDRDAPFSLRVTEQARVAYGKAAARAGLTLSEWVRVVLDAAAGVSNLDEQLRRARSVQVIDVGGLNAKQLGQFADGLEQLRQEALEAQTPVDTARIEALVRAIKDKKVRDGKW